MNYEELQQGIQDNLPIPSRDELWEAIENNDLEKYTPKQIEQGMLQEKDGRNLYHEASKYGHLEQIPKEFLTAENLLKHEKYSWNGTCIHWAAMNSNLDKIPLLSYETLTELKTHFETKDSSYSLGYKEDILKTLNDLLEKKLKRLEIIARSQTINHDTDIL
jgi:hypothetical protein